MTIGVNSKLCLFATIATLFAEQCFGVTPDKEVRCIAAGIGEQNVSLYTFAVDLIQDSAFYIPATHLISVTSRSKLQPKLREFAKGQYEDYKKELEWFLAGFFRAGHPDVGRLVLIHNEIVKAASRHLEAQGIAHEIETISSQETLNELEANSPNLLQIRLSEGTKSLFNKFRKVTKDYQTDVLYFPIEVLDANAKFRNEGTAGIIYLSHDSVVAASPKHSSLVHEFSHVRNWFNLLRGIASKYTGFAKVISEEKRLPGDSENYVRGISFDEVEAYRRGLPISVKEQLAQALKGDEGWGDAHIDLIGSVHMFRDVCQRIDLIVSGFQNTLKSKAEESKIVFETSGETVVATLTVEGQYTTFIPLPKSTGIADPQNMSLLKDHITNLSTAVHNQLPLANALANLVGTTPPISKEKTLTLLRTVQTEIGKSPRP